MIKNFEIPTQVVFHTTDEPEIPHYGIGYSDIIICGCCGGTFPLDEEELAKVEALPWVNFEDFIGKG